MKINISALQKAWRSVVMVQASNYRGSGVVVADELVVSNFHVVENNIFDGAITQPNTILTTPSGRRVYGEIIKIDPRHDLCLIRAPGLELPAAKMIDEAPPVNQRVFNLAWPRGEFDYKTGHVIASRLADDYSGIFASSAECRTGASGGGTFNESGELAGIIAFGDPRYGEMTLSLPLHWVKQILADTPPLIDERQQTEVEKIANSISLEALFQWMIQEPDCALPVILMQVYTPKALREYLTQNTQYVVDYLTQAEKYPFREEGDRGFFYQDLADLALEFGQTSLALKYHEQTLAEKGNPVPIIMAFTKLAWLTYEQDLSKAYSYLDQAAQIPCERQEQALHKINYEKAGIACAAGDRAGLRAALKVRALADYEGYYSSARHGEFKTECDHFGISGMERIALLREIGASRNSGLSA